MYLMFTKHLDSNNNLKFICLSIKYLRLYACQNKNVYENFTNAQKDNVDLHLFILFRKKKKKKFKYCK